MCLGAGAAAANEQARRDYQYKLDRREQAWMQDLSLTKQEHVQYEQGINNTNLGLANVYADLHEEYGDLYGQMLQEDETSWKEFLANSGKLAASGVTGRSADRIQTLDLAKYLTESNRKVINLNKQGKELRKQSAQAYGKVRAQQMDSFAKVAMVKMPDLAPPQPVMRNVGAAAFMDAISIATPIVGMISDKKLKENIKKLGESISGLGIYKFNYKGDATKWIGTMADEVKKIKPEAVFTMKNGYEGVRYDLIDVKMRRAV